MLPCKGHCAPRSAPSMKQGILDITMGFILSRQPRHPRESQGCYGSSAPCHAHKHPSNRLEPLEISAPSLRVDGATALLHGRVDLSNIWIMGRWHIDTMMRYLLVQAQPILGNYAAHIVMKVL
jgi:hypothetical protein